MDQPQRVLDEYRRATTRLRRHAGPRSKRAPTSDCQPSGFAGRCSSCCTPTTMQCCTSMLGRQTKRLRHPRSSRPIEARRLWVCGSTAGGWHRRTSAACHRCLAAPRTQANARRSPGHDGPSGAARSGARTRAGSVGEAGRLCAAAGDHAYPIALVPNSAESAHVRLLRADAAAAPWWPMVQDFEPVRRSRPSMTVGQTSIS